MSKSILVKSCSEWGIIAIKNHKYSGKYVVASGSDNGIFWIFWDIKSKILQKFNSKEQAEIFRKKYCAYKTKIIKLHKALGGKQC